MGAKYKFVGLLGEYKNSDVIKDYMRNRWRKFKVVIKIYKNFYVQGGNLTFLDA